MASLSEWSSPGWGGEASGEGGVGIGGVADRDGEGGGGNGLGGGGDARIGDGPCRLGGDGASRLGFIAGSTMPWQWVPAPGLFAAGWQAGGSDTGSGQRKKLPIDGRVLHTSRGGSGGGAGGHGGGVGCVTAGSICS